MGHPLALAWLWAAPKIAEAKKSAVRTKANAAAAFISAPVQLGSLGIKRFSPKRWKNGGYFLRRFSGM
jgi:hypothetical protein